MFRMFKQFTSVR